MNLRAGLAIGSLIGIILPCQLSFAIVANDPTTTTHNLPPLPNPMLYSYEECNDYANAAACFHIFSNNFHLVDVASGIGIPDGLIGVTDLQAVLGDATPGQFTPLQVGAYALLMNFSKLDTLSGNGSPDGLIGTTDLQALLNQFASIEELCSALYTMPPIFLDDSPEDGREPVGLPVPYPSPSETLEMESEPEPSSTYLPSEIPTDFENQPDDE